MDNHQAFDDLNHFAENGSVVRGAKPFMYPQPIRGKKLRLEQTGAFRHLRGVAIQLATARLAVSRAFDPAVRRRSHDVQIAVVPASLPKAEIFATDGRQERLALP